MNKKPPSNEDDPSCLPLDLAELLDDIPNIPEEQRKSLRVLIQVLIERKFFAGHLPSPEALLHYKQVKEDAPERIIAMAEKEQESHIAMRRRFADYMTRGQLFAFLLAITVLGFHAFLASIGQTWQGFVISGPVLGSMVAAFLFGFRGEKR